MPVGPSALNQTEIPGLLRQALTDHLEGRLEQAEALYRTIVEREPEHVRALGMLAMVLADGSDEAAAETMLLRHLQLAPTDGASLHRLGRLRARQGDDAAAVELFVQAVERLPALAPIHNDLGVSLHQLGRGEEGLKALDRALAIDPGFADAHHNRTVLLSTMERHDEAVRASLATLAHLAPEADALRASSLRQLAKAAHKTGRLDIAVAAARTMPASAALDAETMDVLAQILTDAGHADEALALRNDYARATGLVRGGLEGGEAPVLLLIGGVGGGHVPTRYLVDKSAFATLSLTLLSPDQPDAPLGGLDPQALRAADVVFNTLGEIEIDHGQLAAVAALAAGLGKPLLNPPALIPRTARDQAEALLAGIPGMVVPPVVRTTPEGLAALPIDRPLLARPAGDHGGENLSLLRSATDRDGYLAANTAATLLLTPFHDFRSADGQWRKYRLIFVDRQVFPYHLAIGQDWLVHYWRAEMAASDARRAEEARFLNDWRAVFGEAGAHAVEAVARRLDLDYGGIDCALLPDGRVLLFEANACMRVGLDEPAALFPYKHRHVPAIRQAFTALARARAAST